MPYAFTLQIEHSISTQREQNGVYVFNALSARWSISDLEGGTGLPFLTANDPRLRYLASGVGFDGASMRDIAAAAEMQAASVYYYFESKEELLWAVWEKGGLELLHRVADANVNKTDPWQRMETACVAHTTGLLDWRRANQALFIMPPWHYPESIRARVIALRDEYEKIFIGLIDDLPLRKGVDRRYLRLAVIGALSWSLFWFKKERDTPAAIAKQMLSMLRAGIED